MNRSQRLNNNENGGLGPDRQPQYSGQPIIERRPEQQPVAPQRSLRRQPDPSIPPQLQPGVQQYRNQRQPSRPDPAQPMLQRQPSRPEEAPRQLQPQLSGPEQYNNYPRVRDPPPMPSPYQDYPHAPAPAFARAPSTRYPLIPNSDSQTGLLPASSSSSSLPYHHDPSIIRGNADDNLDKSDQFWRHFNASAHQQQLPDIEKSSWLEKTQGKSSRSRRTLWIVGLFFLLLAGGGIGIGIFLSVRSHDNEDRPSAIGGSADNTSDAGAAPAPATAVAAGTATSSSLHVSPTNTVP